MKIKDKIINNNEKSKQKTPNKMVRKFITKVVVDAEGNCTYVELFRGQTRGRKNVNEGVLCKFARQILAIN